MQITLVRHGEPEWVRDGLNVDNPPLTALGHLQAELVGARLAEEEFDEIYVSPLVRTRQTAAPLLATLGRPEVIADWLEEIRNPIWHGTPLEKAEEAYKADRARPSLERWEGLPGGEPVRDFVARVRGGATEFLAERGIAQIEHELPIWHLDGPGRRLLFVAHAGTNSVLTSFLLCLDPTPFEWDRFVLGHTSVTRLEAIPVGDGHTFSLTMLANQEHLAKDQRTR